MKPHDLQHIITDLRTPDEYGLYADEYHSYGSYQMARRRARAYSQTYEDYALQLGLKFKFHLNLRNHKPEKVEGVLRCLAAGKEFILYQDSENYTIFIPKTRLAVCYKHGEEYTQDISGTDEDWQERIKMAMLGYDNIFERPNQINGQVTQVLQLRQEDSPED